MKPEKTGLRIKVISFSGQIKMKIPGSIAAPSTIGASSGASSTHGVPDVVVDDDGRVTIPSGVSYGKKGAHNP